MPLTLLAIDVGSAPGDRTGNPARIAFQKVNTNFALVAGAMEDAEIKAFVIACSGNKVDLVVEDDVKSLRMPYSFVLLEVLADVNNAATGDDIVIDIKVDGSSILMSGGLVILAGDEINDEGTAPALEEPIIILRRSKITIDVLTVGSISPGQGLNVQFIGYVINTSY